MAPDLNSLPSSRNSPRLSRTTSASMPPPPVPATGSQSTSSPPLPQAQPNNMAEGTAGPIRHPRPLTAAELHLEMEKEQESIVNRLTRELSILRAQTASVASTTSSTSDMHTTAAQTQLLPNDPYTSAYQPGTGASIIPTSARRQRSSSSLSHSSSRSVREGLTALASSVSGVAAPREQDRPRSRTRDRDRDVSACQSLDIARPAVSRQSSTTSFREQGHSMLRSPSAQSPYIQPGPSHTRGASISSVSGREVSSTGGTREGLGLGMERTPSFGSAAAQQRYEEAALQRQELEQVKKENEALRQRVKDLEAALRGGSLATQS